MREVLCVKCPICGRELHHRVGNGNRKTLRCNLKRHLYNMHQVNGTDAEKYAIELGMGSDGTPLELAIKEWDELVAAGVIKEVPR